MTPTQQQTAPPAPEAEQPQPPAPKQNSILSFSIDDLDISQETASEYVALEVRHKQFLLDQREAEMYAKSDIVPDTYRNKVGNCVIAINIARRLRIDTLMVMQNLFIVKGKPAWSGKFLIAAFNATGRFGNIRYEKSGTPGSDDYGYTAYAIKNGERVEGPKVDWRMVKAENWLNKDGSKWKTIPELMFRYRSAGWLVNTTAPEITMGFPTVEEVEDVEPDVMPERRERPALLREIEQHLDAKAAEAKPATVETKTPEPETKSAEPETKPSDPEPEKPKAETKSSPVSQPNPGTLKLIRDMEPILSSKVYSETIQKAGFATLEDVFTEEDAQAILAAMMKLTKKGK